VVQLIPCLYFNQIGEVNLRLLELNLELVFDQDIDSWANIASTLRGVWGRTLKKLYCYQKQSECHDCVMSNCTYYTLFEKKYGDSGQFHPYIILPIVKGTRSAKILFKFFGWAAEHYDKLLYSLLEIGTATMIIDGNHTRPQIMSITDGCSNLVYSQAQQIIHRPCLKRIVYEPQAVSSVTLQFLTPLRQKSGDKLMQHFVWDSFIKSLLNRIKYMNTYFNDSAIILPDYIQFDGVEVTDAQFRWQEQVRKSFRQQQVMSLGGLTGSVKLSNLTPECFGILKLGSAFHAGKQTTFGNGFYRIKTASE
jgi:hypothetical protein